MTQATTLKKVFLMLSMAAILLLIGLKYFYPDEKKIHCQQNKTCPNIILVILDDMPWSHFGFLSGGISATPHLDQLANEGFVFRNVYNTNSRCRASLATYLTGQLPHQNLIYSNQGVLKLQDKKALTRVLSEAGYATFAGGKMWEGDPEQLELTESDLDTFHFVRSSQDRLNRFLDTYANKQALFVWWAPMLPHKNHNAPDAYLQQIKLADIPLPAGIADEDKEAYRHSERAFLATIAWVDDEIGALRKSLIRHDLDKNTWIIVLADNGWSNAYPAKGSAYDIGVRTPMVIDGPGVEAGHTDALLSTQNLYGSILSLAGLEASDDRKAGKNFFSLAVAPENISTRENTVHWASYPSYTGKSEPHPRAGRDVYALSLRQDNWQYTVYLKSFADMEKEDEKAPALIHLGLENDFNYHAGDEELFDLSTDHFSRHNLVDVEKNRALIMELRKKVFEWWRITGGKNIDAVDNCREEKTLLCEKYRQVYPVSGW